MDWKAILALASVFSAVAAVFAAVYALWRIERRRRLKAETSAELARGNIRRLLDEREISEMTPDEIRDELTTLLDNWKPIDGE